MMEDCWQPDSIDVSKHLYVVVNGKHPINLLQFNYSFVYLWREYV